MSSWLALMAKSQALRAAVGFSSSSSSVPSSFSSRWKIGLEFDHFHARARRRTSSQKWFKKVFKKKSCERVSVVDSSVCMHVRFKWLRFLWN